MEPLGDHERLRPPDLASPREGPLQGSAPRSQIDDRSLEARELVLRAQAVARGAAPDALRDRDQAAHRLRGVGLAPFGFEREGFDEERQHDPLRVGAVQLLEGVARGMRGASRG